MLRTLPLVAVALLFAFASIAGEKVALPPPQKAGGPDVLSAIDNRGSESQGNFPKGELSPEDVSTLLWAASGHNRDGKKWTVPMGMGVPPYCKVYYADATGAYRYDWRSHSLVKVTGENIIPRTVTQEFARRAPAVLFLVEDAVEKSKIMADDWREEFTVLLSGMMAENVYLASQGRDVGVRLVYSLHRLETAKLLGLPEGDRVFFAMILGKK